MGKIIKTRKKIVLALLAAVVCCLLVGCGETRTNINSIEELYGKKIAVVTGSIYENVAKDNIPNPNLQYYANIADCFYAANEGKVDALVVSENYYNSALDKFPNMKILGTLCNNDFYYAMSKTAFGALVCSDLSEYLKKEWESGRQQELLDQWKNGEKEAVVFDFSDLTGEKGVIHAAVEPLDLPYTCYIGDGYSGIEAENLYNFCKEYGYGLEMETQDWNAILNGVVSGKIDLCMYTYYTEERAQKILFAEPYEQSNIVAVTKDASYKGENIIDLIADSFKGTFITESRWKLLVDGLKITAIIVFFSAIFGTLFGGVLCWIHIGNNKILSKIVSIIVKVFQGVPIVVLLLILYYVIFSSSGIPGVIVGVIGFSLDFGTAVCETLRAGINSIDKGQYEGAQSLGLSRPEILFKVILPQAIRIALPVYKGQFISMVKLTSVVGYIAVQDITKAADIIRSRTYEPFFPMIFTAVIYFIIAWLFTRLLNKVEIQIDPKLRKRVLKDIDTSVDIPEYQFKKAPVNLDEVVLRIKHLKKEYELSTPLKDINAEIMKGDVIAIIGPSGTGKSTLIRCVNRIEKPTSGEIYAFGKKLPEKEKDLCNIRRRIGMVAQSYNLFHHLTVIENIMLAPVTLKMIPRQEAYEKGIGLLKKVGLAEKSLRYPMELSGGEKQRVAIVRALIMEPDVLLFDEPTSALDPTMTGEVLRVIKDVANQKITMMIVTHAMKFARDVSSRVFYLDQGEVYEDGPTEQIFDNPKKELTRAFIKNLKLFNYDISSRDFDYLKLLDELEHFCHVECLDRQQIMRVELCAEELTMQGLIKADEAEFPARLVVECDEEANLKMYLGFGGPKIDLMSVMDNVSQNIVLKQSKSIEQTWSEEQGNEVVVEI